MAISPATAEELAKAVLELYLRAELTMLEQVARRVARGIDADGWAEKKLAEVQTLRTATEAEIARLTGQASDAVETAVRDAYNRGVATAGTDLRGVGVSRELAFGRVNLAAVDALIQDTVGRLDGTRTRILRSVLDGYRDVIAQTSGDVLTGTVTRRQAAQRALDLFAKRGITGLVDSAGRGWDLASYAEMATRTAVGRAAVDGHAARLLEVGFDLVIVSDVPMECELCRPWEGAVLSISGQTSGTVRAENLRSASGGTVAVRVVGTLDEARAAGLQHPNCRHTIGLYQPGVTRPFGPTEDPEGAAARQEARRLERGVREWRRREAVAISPEAAAEAKRKAAVWEQRRKDHVAATMPQSERYSAGRTRLGAR